MNEAASRPFDGVRIVEFGQFVAIPFCAQLLAEGGAEVIKIESLQGDPTRLLVPLAPHETRTFISRNRGKHSLPLDLRHPQAQRVLDALLDWADVVLTNFRPGRAAELGLDAASLSARKPRLIVGNVTAFGERGPEAGLAGMDIVVQARTGLMAANGRMVDGRPAPGDPVSADYMCAMSMAFGVSAALLRRERTGVGGAVDTSLMQAAMLIANSQLLRSEVHDGPVHERALATLAAQRAAGESFATQQAALPSARASSMLMVYFRTYDTADRTIAIGCGSAGLREKFITAIGLGDPMLGKPGKEVPPDYYPALAASIEALFRTQPAEHWVAVLQAAGVPVAAVRFPIEMFDDEQARANGMLHRLEHPSVGPMTVVGPPVRLSGDGFQPGRAMAAFGSESRALLAQIGIAETDIEALVNSGVTLAS